MSAKSTLPLISLTVSNDKSLKIRLTVISTEDLLGHVASMAHRRQGTQNDVNN